MVWVVSAELYVWPPGPLFQPGLGYFQRTLFVFEGLLQRFNQHLCLEDLLQSLVEDTRQILTKWLLGQIGQTEAARIKGGDGSKGGSSDKKGRKMKVSVLQQSEYKVARSVQTHMT